MPTLMAVLMPAPCENKANVTKHQTFKQKQVKEGAISMTRKLTKLDPRITRALVVIGTLMLMVLGAGAPMGGGG